MSGKWHLQKQPTDYGFDRYFGHLSGATDYFRGNDKFRLNGEPFKVLKSGFYTTTAMVDYAIKFLNDACVEKTPWLLYVAFNALHSPFQPLTEDYRQSQGSKFGRRLMQFNATTFVFIFSILLSMGADAASTQGGVTLNAKDFGLRGDGRADDGPAIRKMLAKARVVDGPVILRFPREATIRVESGESRYAFRLDRVDGLMIDGNGSTFQLAPELRFLNVTRSKDFGMGRLNIELTQQPAVEATALNVSEDGKELQVRIDAPERISELGGPTGLDGEQQFFGMLWLPENSPVRSEHFYVGAVEQDDKADVARVTLRKPLPMAVIQQIQLGDVRCSLPVPGIAHRYGPGPMIRIDRCENVILEDVEVWDAPWFAFQIFRNEGELVFRRVNVRPPPGSQRITSSWRDGFHVKGNVGSLLFEDCILEGVNDDAFNVSAHAWSVSAVVAPDRVRIEQIFPLQMMPPQPGGTAFVLSSDGTRGLDSAKILEVIGLPDLAADDQTNTAKVPELEVVLDRPIAGLEVGCAFWDTTRANPQTTIRGCRIRNSCRFQSPVTLENCEVDGLLWFYSESEEGPMPTGSAVRNSVLRQGRGNPELAVAITGWRGNRAPEILPESDNFPLRDIRFIDNEFHGGFQADGVVRLVLDGNRFVEPTNKKRPILLKNIRDAEIRRNLPKNPEVETTE